MRMCPTHWERLRTAIADRGLEVLVPTDGETAAHHLVARATGPTTIDNFDPLMDAMTAIMMNALRVAGSLAPEILAEDSVEEPICPQCWLTAYAAGHSLVCDDPRCGVMGADVEAWTDRAADDQLESWKALAP